MPRRSFPIIPGSPPERLRPPPDLGPEARELFIDIVTDCRPEHFRSTDSPLIVTYCHAILSSQQAWANLQSDGWVVDGKPSQWLAIWAQALKVTLAFARALRLVPLARAPSRPSRPGKPTRPLSVYERMAMGDDDGDDAA